MNIDDLKNDIFEIINEGIKHGEDNYGIPTNQTIHNIANDIIEECFDNIKSLIENRDGEIYKQESFAEQEGFTPDCTPYYIALQYKKRAEVAERKAKYIDNAFHSQMLKIALDYKYAKKFIKFTFGTITRIYEEAVENAIKQAEKELQEGKK